MKCRFWPCLFLLTLSPFLLAVTGHHSRLVARPTAKRAVVAHYQCGLWPHAPPAPHLLTRCHTLLMPQTPQPVAPCGVRSLLVPRLPPTHIRSCPHAPSPTADPRPTQMATGFPYAPGLRVVSACNHTAGEEAVAAREAAGLGRQQAGHGSTWGHRAHRQQGRPTTVSETARGDGQPRGEERDREEEDRGKGKSIISQLFTQLLSLK